MIRDSDLIKKRFSELKDCMFYRQRFDACPHFMFFVGDAHGSDCNHSKYPFGQRITCARFSKNKADWYHIFSELEYTAEKIMDLAKENPAIADEIIAEFKPWEDKFYGLCMKLQATDTTAFGDAQLIERYKELASVYVKKLDPSPLIDGFALTTDGVIAEKVELFLEEKGMLKDFVKHFEVLTAPTFLSFLQQEHIDLLRLAKKVEHNPQDEIALVKEHQKKYFWIRNNYVADNVLDVDFFAKRIESFKGKDVDALIKKIKCAVDENTQRKNDLIQQLNLPQEIVDLLHITDRFNYYQDERKKGTFWATHYFSILLEELAKRTKYSLEELKYAFPSEIDDLAAQKISREELQARITDCFLTWVADSYDVVTDTAMIEEIIDEDRDKSEDTKEIRGMSVSLGVATGTVKVVKSVDQISKVDEGDVLVSVMTRPDYIPAMQKAAAFVTDEGGLTCHAAIVARELKVPCIVGTRIATKVLKDGDLVKVDANHSWIKILK